MVSENRQAAQGRLQLGQKTGAGVNDVSRTLVMVPAKGLGGHKISGQHHQVRPQSVDHGDGFADRHHGKISVVVEVAELHDAQTIPDGGQALERNFDLHQFRIVGFENGGVGSDRQGAGRGRCQKFPSSKKGQTEFLVPWLEPPRIRNCRAPG